jgi:hypothetical protein
VKYKAQKVRNPGYIFVVGEFFLTAEDNKKPMKLIAAAIHLNVAEPLDS